ncbi:MAG: DUF4249 family protein [candidate division WOR-3 bacterium]|nr:MAG: DUF4249 family protein [candidate division WOR-3 bacterium]
MKKNMIMPYRNIAIYCTVTLFLIFSACENNIVQEYESQLNVVAVLNSMNQVQHVLVERAYLVDEPSEPPIDDALVVLSGNGFIDTLIFTYESYRYWTEPFDLAPLATYELLVAREGFDTVTAVTTIPGYFVIQYPTYNTTITLQDTMVITRSADAALYGCLFLENVSNLSIFFWYEPNPLDSLIHIPIGEYLDSPPPGYYAITVVACDSNVYNYYFAADDSIRQCGVTGGVGLFGSTWAATSSAYLLVE